jgi:hypothetical protein
VKASYGAACVAENESKKHRHKGIGERERSNSIVESNFAIVVRMYACFSEGDRDTNRSSDFRNNVVNRR